MKRLYLLSLFVLVSSAAWAQNAGDILNRVQKKYASLNNVCATFTQTFEWKLANETQVFEGQVCTRNGVQFRVENSDQTIITDGKTIWTMPRNARQVIIDDAAESPEDNPFLKTFMQNYVDNYKPEYLGEVPLGGQPHDHLRLTARSEDVFAKEIEIWVEKKSLLMTKIRQIDVNDNVSTYEISKVDVNAKLTEASFRPDISPDYEVVDLR